MDPVTGAQIVLAIGAAAASFRVVRGPSIADRIIALDLVLLLLASAMGAEIARTGEDLFATPVIVVALVAFAGTVLGARFIEWRDVPEEEEEEGQT